MCVYVCVDLNVMVSMSDVWYVCMYVCVDLNVMVSMSDVRVVCVCMFVCGPERYCEHV